MNSFVRFATALALACAVSSANAADVPLKPLYKAEPAFNWRFYGGLNLGYVNAESDGLAALGLGELNPKGAFVGLTAGYNWHVSRNWVLGIEADISAGDISDSIVLGLVDSQTSMFGTLRARAGYSFGSSLLYATGGLAWADTKATLAIFTDRKTLYGWTAGFGYEWAFAPRWSAKAEYLYTDLDAENFFTGLVPGGIAVGANSHTFKLGVDYRFGQ
jgi:outer membrane immunogenic protein